jgi:hypothetical protein
VYIQILLTSALVAGKWSASRPGRFTPGERTPGTLWIGGWVGPRASLDDLEKGKFLILPGLELRLLGHPARSQLLYRLSYPGPRKLLRASLNEVNKYMWHVSEAWTVSKASVNITRLYGVTSQEAVIFTPPASLLVSLMRCDCFLGDTD